MRGSSQSSPHGDKPRGGGGHHDSPISGLGLRHGEAVEEKISLSERFGLWLSFHPFNQDSYLAIVEHCLKRFGGSGHLDEETRRAALEWALTRGSRSGRVAWQFSRDWVGREGTHGNV